MTLVEAVRPVFAGPAFTPEQRTAISDRAGSRLLAANAGSGKTAVMVERFVEAVLHDGVKVGAILALTFTEKAAGELRERLRRRFTELGRGEEAREAEGAWVGTIHGFCARVLRSHPLAAGLDPGFEVLDELAARRVANAAFERALDSFTREHGAAGLDLAAAYGAGLRDLTLSAYLEMRSRGQTAPRLKVPSRPSAPDPSTLATARTRAAAVLGSAKPGIRVTEGITALQACAALLAEAGRAGVPYPGALDPAALGTAAAVLKQPECEEYRTAFSAYRQACADHHAHAAVTLIASLLERYHVAYTEAKRHRSAVDFEDLELCVRDLLRGHDALRERWSQRFAMIMVDEFQDTNRLQLDVLEALERDNLFAVGDEFQSIYGFRHADVTIFRDRRAMLGAARTSTLRVNFRSREELLDVVNQAFTEPFGERFVALVAGREETDPEANGSHAGVELRLFDPDEIGAGTPAVELLVTDTRGWGDDAELEAAIGLAGLAEQPWRRAEARRVGRRLREEVDGGRRQGDVVVLVRATASLRILEQALEDEGLTTYVVGGRGYWSQEQVRDGLAYLRAVANPLDEEALLGVLASPFAGVGSDALVLLARAGRDGRRGMWAALRDVEGADWSAELAPESRERLVRFAGFLARERDAAPRLAAEALLERALAHTGYDVAILRRPDGERRLANLRKLMRLAREYERAEGRDLRAFLDFAATQELEAAREGEAPLESEGLDAIRLMTIHRAKGLEFGVVCVADLGREPARGTDPLLIGHDGTVGLRLLTLGGGKGVPALAHEALASEKAAADAEEERRLFYVAMTRARDKLILAGGIDAGRWPAPKPGAAPLTWVSRALLGDRPSEVLSADSPEALVRGSWKGRATSVRAELLTHVDAGPLTTRKPRAASAQTVLPAAPTVAPAPPAAPGAQLRPGPSRLSYSSLGDYARCPYRFYLRRLLGLADVPEPAPSESTPEVGAPGLDARVRGTLVHALLEELDFRRPMAPGRHRVAALAATQGVSLTEEEEDDVIGLVTAFTSSSLRERLAAAGRSVRREAPFAFVLDDSPDAPLLTGFVDVMATEPDGSVLIVDYKSDRLEADDTPEASVQRAYATQRLVYALAALRAGAPRVEVAHCYLERPADPAVASFSQRDASDLAERLLELAAGVRAARYPVTPDPHRELCGTCPGRPALCSHPEELTLRPA